MKLLIAIVNNDDSAVVSSALTKEGYTVTKLSTTGGFLMVGNTTFLIGADDDKVAKAKEIIKEYSQRRMHTAASTAAFGIYMRLRDIYPQSALMESSDYHDSNNSHSFIGINPIASVAISHGEAICTFLRGTYTHKNLDFTKDVLAMRDEGFDTLSMEPVVLKDNPELAITEEDLPRVREEYDRLTKAYMDAHKAGKGFFFFHFNMDLSNGPCVAKRLSGCGAGHEYMAVAENGDLYPCHQFVGREKYRLGSLDEGVTDTHWPQYFRS